MRRLAVVVLVVSLASACDRVFGSAPRLPDSGGDAPLDAAELPGTWAAIAGGDTHTCGIRLDGTLWCWGSTDTGALGTGSVAAVVARPQQIGTATWQAVATRSDHTCAIARDATLWCWGANAYGELGIGALGDTPTPTRLAGSWRSVTVGYDHTCGIRSDGSLACWGRGDLGQTAAPGFAMADPTPRTVGDDTWRAVAAGAHHTCAIRADDRLLCFGDNSLNQLGAPGVAKSDAPRAVGEDTWERVAGASFATCGRRTDGRLRCWGHNDAGQLGNGTINPQSTPMPVAGDAVTDWLELTGGERHFCARRAGDRLYCWGSNLRGQVAAGERTLVTEPTELFAISRGWLQVTTGQRHTCAIDGLHRLWCAGEDAGAQLARGGGDRVAPSRVPGTWKTVVARRRTTCALDAAGDAYCWGYNANGEVGDGTADAREVPTRIAAPGGAWDGIALGTAFGCAWRGGNRWCWGTASAGQYGNPALPSSLVPVPVDGEWAHVALGDHVACGTKLGTRAAYCWGLGTNGELGTGAAVSTFDPQPIKAPGALDALALGDSHSCGLDAGTAYCWGNNASGELGIGSAGSDRTEPTLVAGGHAFAGLASNSDQTCGVATNGALWCWGVSSIGELGALVGTTAAPALLAPGAWRAVATGIWHTCAIASDATLACTGWNLRGELGDGSFAVRYALAPIAPSSSARGWRHVALGEHHTCAIDVEDALYCWGSNRHGELGDDSAWSAALEPVE